MDFLGITGKTFLLFGVANRKSIAWYVGQTLEQCGATVLYSVRSEQRDIEKQFPIIDGILHSIAFANFSEGFKPFHETKRADFLQATEISCFSLVEIAKYFKTLLSKNASVVTMGISSQVTAVHYGYMSPIKAALRRLKRLWKVRCGFWQNRSVPTAKFALIASVRDR